MRSPCQADQRPRVAPGIGIERSSRSGGIAAVPVGMMLAGCRRTGLPAGPRAGRRHVGRDRAGGRPSADAILARARSPARLDRPRDLPRAGGYHVEHLEGPQPVPVHRHPRGQRHRLRPLLRHGPAEALPDRFRLGGGDLRLRRRRPDRSLLRHVHDAPAGRRADGTEPAVPEPRRWPVSRRDRVVGAGLPRGSATGSSPATSTTTATRMSSCAITGRMSCTSTTATARSGTSVIPRASTARTGPPAGRCSITTTTATWTFTSPTTAIGVYPRDAHRCGTERGPALLLAVGDPHDQTLPLPQQRRRHLHRRDRRSRRRPYRWPWLRRGRRRSQRRRPGRPLCRQRHEPELPLPQPG